MSKWGSCVSGGPAYTGVLCTWDRVYIGAVCACVQEGGPRGGGRGAEEPDQHGQGAGARAAPHHGAGAGRRAGRQGRVRGVPARAAAQREARRPQGRSATRYPTPRYLYILCLTWGFTLCFHAGALHPHSLASCLLG